MLIEPILTHLSFFGVTKLHLSSNRCLLLENAFVYFFKITSPFPS